MRGGQWKNGGYCSGVRLDDKISEDKIFQYKKYTYKYLYNYRFGKSTQIYIYILLIYLTSLMRIKTRLEF